VYGAQVATCQTELRPHLLYQVLDRHAEQQATQLSLLSRAYSCKCQLRYDVVCDYQFTPVTNTISDNLDQELAAFLKKWFPDEVKTRQRYNELMAGIDQYGEVYATQKCVVMQ
jgi:hypothetical protein